jgi:hypothetical protein
VIDPKDIPDSAVEAAMDAQYASHEDAISEYLMREAIQAAVNDMLGDPVGWVLDWPEEPELGRYFSESPSSAARSRALYAIKQGASRE